jgi:pimeloyl-ACP methyl ester carboxylesterase
MIEDFARLAARRTLLVYDVRNRGLSDPVADSDKLAAGIHNDVDDLDRVRRHFGLDAIDVIGHSYMGAVAALFAMKYPASVRRVVQIGAVPPEAGKQYPPDLTCMDTVFHDVMSKMAAVQQERATLAPLDFCRRFWEVLAPLFVANPADAGRVKWHRCELPNEMNFMAYWMRFLQPSMQKTVLTSEMFASVRAPVLTIHGTHDRSAPYGGGQDWAGRLPTATLLRVENAGHGPWIEAPDLVFDSIERFLDDR